MFKIYSLLLLCIQALFVNAQDKQVIVYSFEEFEPLLQHDNDTVYVVNFWATWCRPCVEELPYFEKINTEYSSEKVKVILVSLDFAEDLNSRLIPFLIKRNVESEVILLNESDPNDFIDKINPKWSGAIPATIIYKGTDYDFYEKSFKYEELESIVKLKLN